MGGGGLTNPHLKPPSHLIHFELALYSFGRLELLL